MDLAALQHFTIQGERSCEALDNILNYAWIVFQRVRIECGHHASRTQIMDADHNVTDPQLPAFPVPLLQALNSANHNIWPKPAPVAPECGDCSVGGYQERKNVE